MNATYRFDVPFEPQPFVLEVECSDTGHVASLRVTVPTSELGEAMQPELDDAAIGLMLARHKFEAAGLSALDAANSYEPGTYAQMVMQAIARAQITHRARMVSLRGRTWSDLRRAFTVFEGGRA